MKITGYTDKVLLRGELMVDGEQWTGQRGAGSFCDERRMGQFYKKLQS